MESLSFVSYKVNSTLWDLPPLGGGSPHTLRPALLPTLPKQHRGGGLFRDLCLARAGHPPGPTQPPQSLSVCKGLSGTGSNKQSQAAKTQGLIMQFMDFPGLFVHSHQLPGALQKGAGERQAGPWLERWPFDRTKLGLSTTCFDGFTNTSHSPKAKTHLRAP